MVGVRMLRETEGLALEPAAEAKSHAARETRSCRVQSRGGLDLHSAVCARGVFSAAQSPAWTRAWASHVAADYVVAAIMEKNEPVFALPLEVKRVGPFKVASFMGGKHSNGNFPAATAAFIASARPAELQALFRSLRQARPDIDVIALERMVAVLDGVSNPLAALPCRPAPNISLELGLEAGFEAILARSKSLRSKHRWQVRKYEAAGGCRRIEAKTEAETKKLLDEFFAQKEVRLKTMGIPNVFGEPRIRTFFHALFAEAVGAEKPAFVLHALEIAGKIRAVTGSSRCGERISCDILSLAVDEFTRTRPGEFLVYENIREATEDGLKVYDFGVGDEPHKRRWCDTEVRHVEVLAPLGPKGHLLVTGLQAGSILKAWIKATPLLWKLVKMVRRRAAGEKPEPEEQAE